MSTLWANHTPHSYMCSSEDEFKTYNKLMEAIRERDPIKLTMYADSLATEWRYGEPRKLVFNCWCGAKQTKEA